MATLQNATTFNGVSVFVRSEVDVASEFHSIAIGNFALGGYELNASREGIFIGRCAGAGVSCASKIIAIGYKAIGDIGNSTHFDSVFIGCGVSACSSPRCRSVIVGNCAARCGLGSDNVVIGFGPGGLFGNQNVLVGSNIGGAYFSGSYNVIIGCGAVNYYGTQNYSVIIGSEAGYCNCGSHNIFIGHNAGSPSEVSHQISIGVNSVAESSYDTSFGNPNMNNRIYAPRNWSNLSDCRDKSCVVDLDENLGLNFIRKLNPISFKYNFRDRYVSECGYEYGDQDGTLKDDYYSYGFSAQNIKETIDELDVKFDALLYSEISDSYRITNAEMISPIIKSLQQTIERLELLEKIIEQKNG